MKTKQTPAISEDEYLEACDSNSGWCTECEEFTGDFAEPDAREYECPACGEKTVFGAEQALLEDKITIE